MTEPNSTEECKNVYLFYILHSQSQIQARAQTKHR